MFFGRNDDIFYIFLDADQGTCLNITIATIRYQILNCLPYKGSPLNLIKYYDRFSLIRSDKPYADSDQIFVYSEREINYIESGGLEEVFADELFYLYPTLVFYNGEETKFAVCIPPEDAGEYKDRVRVVPPAEYLVGFHRGSYDNRVAWVTK